MEPNVSDPMAKGKRRAATYLLDHEFLQNLALEAGLGNLRNHVSRYDDDSVGVAHDDVAGKHRNAGAVDSAVELDNQAMGYQRRRRVTDTEDRQRNLRDRRRVGHGAV